MEKLTWTVDLSLDEPRVDEAHQQLIKTLADIADTPDAQLGDRLFAFIKEIEADFQQEEALMETIKYPAIKPHREQHARVLSSFHQVVPDLMKGNAEPAREVLELFSSWLVLHIKTVDKALALYLKN